MSELTYKVIIGLEIHVQLNTQTKMFCACETSFGDQPNSHVCPVCLGLPGALPVMNKQAYEYSVLAALALNCNIPRFTKWDRKSYFYPDLPKAYQISQYDLPMSEHGYIEINGDDGQVKKIRITRAHLEEDAGKNSHEAGNYSQVDLNRAGTPLLEIVTEPDLSSGAEVREMAQQLQKIVQYLGVSEANMQMGHMRFEPNVNLHITRDGKLYKTPISEIKNLNSFRALERAVNFEVARQLTEFEEEGVTMETGFKSTRGWDDDNQVTVLQRVKEEANDYRYFPDPDLVPVVITDAWLDEIKGRLPELPLAKQMRYVSEFGLSDYDAAVLTTDRMTAEFFEQAVSAGADAKRVCNLLTQTGLKLANDAGKNVADFGFTADQFAQLCKLADEGTISATAANRILTEMTTNPQDPQKLAESMNLIQKSDAGELAGVVEEVIAANPKAVGELKASPDKIGKVCGFLMGQIMKKTKGQANPQVVQKLLREKLQA